MLPVLFFCFYTQAAQSISNHNKLAFKLIFGQKYFRDIPKLVKYALLYVCIDPNHLGILTTT